MQVEERIIPYKRPDIFRIYPISCTHYGTVHCAEEEIDHQFGLIKRDKLARWVGLGDYGEFIAPGDKRFDRKVISKWVDPDNIAVSQTEYIVKKFRPIISQCDGLLEGNHEDGHRLHNNVDVQRNLCHELGVPNLGYNCFIRYLFKRGLETRSRIGYFTHGSGWAVTKGAKLNRLERMMDSFEADFYAHAHVHDIITTTKHYLVLDRKNRIIQETKVGAMTGCWFRTYSQDVSASYGAKKNYPPTAIGCPVFIINPDKGELRVEG